MICGSPRHSVWLIPRWVAPVPPAIFAVPMTGSRSEGPCPRLEAAFWSLTDVEGAWNFLPQRRKSGFLEMGELCSLGHVSSLPFWESRLCFLWQRGRTALSGPVAPVTCQELQTLQQHPGWKREEAEARAAYWSLTNTSHAGDQEQNK